MPAQYAGLVDPAAVDAAVSQTYSPAAVTDCMERCREASNFPRGRAVSAGRWVPALRLLRSRAGAPSVVRGRPVSRRRHRDVADERVTCSPPDGARLHAPRGCRQRRRRALLPAARARSRAARRRSRLLQRANGCVVSPGHASASRGAGIEIHIELDGPRFVGDATRGIEGAIGALLAITARAMIDGSWQRLKAAQDATAAGRPMTTRAIKAGAGAP